MTTVLGNDKLRPHAAVLRLLGVDGMSDDESEDEGHDIHDRRRRVLRVRRPIWRARHLTQFVIVIDTVTLLDRGHSQSGGTYKGSLPLIRIRDHTGATVSSRRNIVKDLPLNAYDEEWLRSLRNPEAVCPQPIYYPFGHDNELLR